MVPLTIKSILSEVARFQISVWKLSQHLCVCVSAPKSRKMSKILNSQKLWRRFWRTFEEKLLVLRYRPLYTFQFSFGSSSNRCGRIFYLDPQTTFRVQSKWTIWNCEISKIVVKIRIYCDIVQNENQILGFGPHRLLVLTNLWWLEEEFLISNT